MASVLSMLMKSSKYLTDETKHSELQSTSTLKLDRSDSLVNERCISDCISLCARVLVLTFKVDEMMDYTVKVIVFDAC